jgi:hypothetical protein
VTSLDLPTALVGSITLEVSDPGTEDPLHAVGDEVPLGVALGMSSNPPLGFKSTLDIASTSVPLRTSVSGLITFFGVRCSFIYPLYLFLLLSALIRRCSDAEERCAKSQVDLNQVSAFLDGARTMKSSLNAQLDSEKRAHEVNSFDCSQYLVARFFLDA